MQTIKGLMKHDHTLTDIIKTFIFFIVLTAPFIAIMVECLYVICNKNAKDSYNYVEKYEIVNTYYETNEVNDINDLQVGNVYTLTYNSGGSFSDYSILCDNFYIIDMGNYDVGVGNRWDTLPYLRITPNFIYISIEQIDNSTIRRYNATYAKIDFILRDKTNTGLLSQYISACPREYIKQTEIVETTTTLDNVFYKAVNNMCNEPIFNWTTETAIYTAVNNMCTGLSIQGGALPILITYWALMTAIYIIFDIVIKLLTTLTHLLRV